jgi:hypothetical protein
MPLPHCSCLPSLDFCHSGAASSERVVVDVTSSTVVRNCEQSLLPGSCAATHDLAMACRLPFRQVAKPWLRAAIGQMTSSSRGARPCGVT